MVYSNSGLNAAEQAIYWLDHQDPGSALDILEGVGKLQRSGKLKLAYDFLSLAEDDKLPWVRQLLAEALVEAGRTVPEPSEA